MKKVLIAAIIFNLLACSERVITVRLPLPPQPVIPTLTNEQLQCVTDKTYSIIVKRDIARSNYAKRLEAVIKATWSE